MNSPRTLDFAICRLFNGGLLVDGLGLVTTDDPRLTDARPPMVHTHAPADVAGLVVWMAATEATAATKQPRGEYHVGLCCVDGTAI